jgi:guanyl-specific ribonuclease Sa
VALHQCVSEHRQPEDPRVAPTARVVPPRPDSRTGAGGPAPVNSAITGPDRALSTVAAAIALQRSVGNRVTTALLASQATAPVMVQRVLTRGSGWGWPGWVDGNAKQLWADLDRKFNQELGVLKGDLETLRTRNPFATLTITAVITEITDAQKAYDRAIPHSEAVAVDKAIDDVMAKGASEKETVPEERLRRIKALSGRLGAPLTGLVVDFQATGLSPQRRKDLLKTLTDLEKNALVPFDETSTDASIRTLETDYTNAKDATSRIRKKTEANREKERLQQEKEAGQSEEERLRNEALRKTISSKIPAYQVLLGSCDYDLELLGKLVAHIKMGEGGQLTTCLSLGTGAEVLALFDVRPIGATQLNKLMTAIGKGEAATLRKLLHEIEGGEEPRLLTVIEAWKGEPIARLLPLLKRFDPATVGELLDQKDPTVLIDLFVTRKINAGLTKALLATNAGPNLIEMLLIQPDVGLLTSLQAVAPDPAGLLSLVSELPNNAGAAGAVRTLFARKNVVTTWVHVLGLQQVKQARGVLTAAGATIAETTVGSLGAHERKAVRECLDGIDTGEAPTLTHPDGARFGAPFGNDQGRLPGVRGAGGYKEYYVEKDPMSGTYHGERRLVVSNETSYVYYSDDHYASFARIR